MAQLIRFNATLILIVICWISVSVVTAQETETCDTKFDCVTLATTIYSDESQKG